MPPGEHPRVAHHRVEVVVDLEGARPLGQPVLVEVLQVVVRDGVAEAERDVLNFELRRITIGPSTKLLIAGRSKCSVKSSDKKIAHHLLILQNGWPSFEHYKTFLETKVLRTIFTQPKVCRSSGNRFVLGLMVMLLDR